MIEPPRDEEEWFDHVHNAGGTLAAEEPSIASSVPEPPDESNSARGAEDEENSEDEAEKDPAIRSALDRARWAVRLFAWSVLANLSPYLFAYLAARGESLRLAMAALADLLIGPLLGLLLSLVGVGFLFGARRRIRALEEPKRKAPQALYRLALLLLVLAAILTLSQLGCLSGAALWLSHLRFPNPRL